MPILKPEEFKHLFYTYCDGKRTYAEAYEMAEMNHEMSFGSRRYSSYDSFQKSTNKK